MPRSTCRVTGPADGRSLARQAWSLPSRGRSQCGSQHDDQCRSRLDRHCGQAVQSFLGHKNASETRGPHPARRSTADSPRMCMKRGCDGETACNRDTISGDSATRHFSAKLPSSRGFVLVLLHCRSPLIRVRCVTAVSRPTVTPRRHAQRMNDDDDLPTPAELEQLARSLAMDGSLGQNDAQRVAEVWRATARPVRRPPIAEQSTYSPS